MAVHLRGVVLPTGAKRDIYVADGRISFEAAKDAMTILDGGYILPGLVDTHCHLSIQSPASPNASPEEQVRASALAELEAGVLALREPGSPNRLSTGLGPHVGLPRVVTAGRFIAARGRYFPGLAREVTEADCADAAVEEAQASDGWAKVIGDFPGPDGRLRPSFQPATLKQVADRVHAAGSRLAIHALLPEVIEAAVAAGFDSIEHGTLMEPTLLDEMARRQVTWVPTLLISEPILDFIQGVGAPRDEVQRVEKGVRNLPNLVRLAAEKGVQVLAGTDAGMVPHGLIAQEVALLRRAGLPPEKALGAASWDARTFLGLPGIEEGAVADLAVYADNPLTNVETLRHPVLRILGGQTIG